MIYQPHIHCTLDYASVHESVCIHILLRHGTFGAFIHSGFPQHAMYVITLGAGEGCVFVLCGQKTDCLVSENLLQSFILLLVL